VKAHIGQSSQLYFDNNSRNAQFLATVWEELFSRQVESTFTQWTVSSRLTSFSHNLRV